MKGMPIAFLPHLVVCAGAVGLLWKVGVLEKIGKLKKALFMQSGRVNNY